MSHEREGDLKQRKSPRTKEKGGFLREARRIRQPLLRRHCVEREMDTAVKSARKVGRGTKGVRGEVK